MSLTRGHDDTPTPKRLRQLSITELFGSFSRKRKMTSIEPEPSSKSSKTSELIMLDEEMEEAHIKNAAFISGANSVNGAANFESAADNGSNVICISDSNEEKSKSDSPTRISQPTPEIFDMVMADKREAINRLLKREITDDFDLSQSQEILTKNENEKSKEHTKEKLEDKLELSDSPDMFETFPTPDFEEEDYFEEETPIINWMGTPRSRLKTAPDCLLPFPKLQPSRNHTVLFDVSFFDFGPPPPSRNVYLDRWDPDHVKLPCSPKSVFPVTSGGESSLVNRWELIENALLSGIKTTKQLEDAIKSYNVHFNQPFAALHTLINDVFTQAEREEFFSSTIVEMIKLALSLPTIITEPIPLLKRQMSHCITLSQQQIACLLSNAFLCTFPRRNSRNPNSEFSNYPTINFNRVLTGTASKEQKRSCIEKLRTILHYFKRVTNEMPSGVITFERHACKDFPVWNRSPCQLCGVHVTKTGRIEEDGKGFLQMDFANKFIGGGVLGLGMVQEEILFSIYPEMLVSRLFTEALDDNECLYMTGAERFSSYSGYASEYKWTGDHKDTNTRDSWRRKVSYFVALDATNYKNSAGQYQVGNFRRELNKLFCGFNGSLDPDYSPAIATGKWGCGAFGGDPIFKALLQMMAAATTCRDLCYFTFDDDQLMRTVHEMHKFLTESKLTVGNLWDLICKYNSQEVVPSVKRKRPISENIFEFIKSEQDSYNASTDED